MSPIDRKREIREHIQANLNRPYHHTQVADIPRASFGKHEKPWTQETANRDLKTMDYRRDSGRHRKNISSTHRPAHPFNRKATTEAEFLGNVA